MNCKKIQNLLSDYIEGLVSEAEKKEIQQHLEVCDRCNLEYQKIEKIIKILRSLPEKNAPDYFSEKVIQKITEKQKKRPKLALWLGRIALAEIAGLILIVVLKQPYQSEIIPQPEKIQTAQKIQQKVETKKTEKQPVNHKKIEKFALEKEIAEKKQAQEQDVSLLAMRETETMDMTEKKRLESKAQEPSFAAVEPIPEKSKPMAKSIFKDSIAGDQLKGSLSETTSLETEIIKYIRSANGKIISDSILDETIVSRLIVAEIPALNYQNLVSQLRSGDKRYLEIKETLVSETTVTVKIQVFK